MVGKTETAEVLYKKLLLAHPLSPEAQTAWTKLTAMGAESSLTTAELHTLGDAYYNAGRYADAIICSGRTRAGAWTATRTPRSGGRPRPGTPTPIAPSPHQGTNRN